MRLVLGPRGDEWGQPESVGVFGVGMQGLDPSNSKANVSKGDGRHVQTCGRIQVESGPESKQASDTVTLS